MQLARLTAALVFFMLAGSMLRAQAAAAAAAPANTPQQSPAQSGVENKPSITLSPAVIMARGSFGQSLTQTLTLSNQTARDFAFELVAEDVVVKDGKRTFVAAGETPNSIAASALFTPKAVVIKAGSSATAEVRLTLPAQTDIRAVVAIFRGTDRLPTSTQSVGMTASLGALITFNLTDNIKLSPEPVRVTPASESANMTISQWISNTGTEPVLSEGTAAVLNASGALAGKTVFEPQRLLPGERQEFTADYPGQLQPGSYRALCSFQFEGKTLTSDANFKVP
jgi:hypothetical protein